MKSLLIVGTADSGPTSPFEIDLDKEQQVNNALLLFGEEIADPIVFQTSSIGCTLTKEPWASVKFITRVQDGYGASSIPEYSISGNILSHSTPAITETSSGWVLYKKRPPESDLAFALRRALIQHRETPVVDSSVSLLRVVSSGATRSQIDAGPLRFTALYPGEQTKQCRVVTTSGHITIYPQPNFPQTRPVTYYFDTPEAAYSVFNRDRIKHKTVLSLVDEINSDARAGTIPISCAISSGTYSHPKDVFSAGSYYLTGGTSPLPTAADYEQALDNVDLSDYCVIVFPAMTGREIFPLSKALFADDMSYPYRLLCSVSGDLAPFTASPSGSRLDRWRHSRLSLVSGRVRSGEALRAESDLSVHYGVILTSSWGFIGLGTRAPLAAELIYTYSKDELDVLADRGVVCPTVGYRGPVIHKGYSTDINSNPVVMAALHGVYRTLIPALYKTVGEPSSQSLDLAGRAAESAYEWATAQGCPILSYSYQTALVNQNLLVGLEMAVAGQIEKVSARVTIPLAAGGARVNL